MADHDVIVLDQDAMMRLWLYDKLQAHTLTEAQADALWRKHQENAKLVANYAATADDAESIYKLARDMRTPLGRVYFKAYGGKMHVVLKGSSRLRTILTGTRYGVRNAKVVGMGIGRYGAIKSAKGGTIITVVLMTVWNVADYVMRDEATLGGLIGGIAADVTKAAIGGAVGAAAGSLAAGTLMIGTFALGPLVVAVGVGLIAGYLLDKLDSRFKLTERLQKLVEDGIEKLRAAAAAQQQSLLRRGSEALDMMAGAVVDLAVDYVVSEVKRRVRPLTWRLVPRL
ncbi:hypothetical protein NF701_07945 [Sphingomonadaceae bacterium OTU29THOMA1]|nr:hypothetical protein NF701_07945 [Sphingomonadaceae bacterium OTU29THOMA1]